MCVVSMVYDHYNTRIAPYWNDPFYNPPPFCPRPHKDGYAREAKKQEDLAKTLKEFFEAREAAEKVDRLTSQPDCADPEKAKLEERVRALERRLAELERARA